MVEIPNNKPWNLYYLFHNKFPQFTTSRKNVEAKINLGIITDNNLDPLYCNYVAPDIPPSLNSQTTAPSTKQTEKQDIDAKSAQKYFEELKSKTNDELRALLNERASAMRKKLDDSERDRLNVKLANQHTYEHWAKFETWTLVQAADLIGGLDPDTTQKIRKSNHRLATGILRISDLINNSLTRLEVTSRKLPPHYNKQYMVYPAKVIEWAEQIEIEIPISLKNAVGRYQVNQKKGSLPQEIIEAKQKIKRGVKTGQTRLKLYLLHEPIRQGIKDGSITNVNSAWVQLSDDWYRKVGAASVDSLKSAMYRNEDIKNLFA